MLLVLWDIDGTLVDTAGHGKLAFDEAFEALHGRPPAHWPPFAGRTDRAITIELLELNGVPSGDGEVGALLGAIPAALDARRDEMVAEGRAQPGAADAVAALAAREGVVQTLLTGNVEANARLKVTAFGLGEGIDFDLGAYGEEHVIRSELVGIARERVSARRGEPVAAEDCVLIGDTPLDVEAARDAGARAVGVATGPYDVRALSAADAVLEDLADADAVLRAVTGAT